MNYRKYKNENIIDKTGQKVNEEIIKNSSNNHRGSIKVKFSSLLIIIMVLLIFVFALCKVMSNNYNNGDTGATENIKSPSIESINDKTNSSKEYYEFIDTEYHTFKFTEDEFINRYMQGNSYMSQGFDKTKGTEANTMIYTKVNIYGIQTIAITANSNNKVSKIQSAFLVTNYEQGQLEQATYNMFSNLMGYVINPNTNDSYEIQKFQTVVQEVLNGQSLHKGLRYSGNIEDLGTQGASITLTLEIIK